MALEVTVGPPVLTIKNGHTRIALLGPSWDGTISATESPQAEPGE
jgi:hypothetical protein